MTRIKRMVMKGFKSFPNKTELVFDNNFSCIIGPNGSGKSNVFDALCFVLGKISSKDMRAEKTANLIYNGGKLKKPAKEGYVSIVFDNSDKTFPFEEDEVEVMRIIRETGQSKYKINGKTITRREILDFLALAKTFPDGYNIILQGDIVKFADMHSKERRMVIEEVSGISVYEEKKAKALRDLEKVQSKIDESNIILAERETHLKELKKDRDQAKRYMNLKERVNVNKATYTHIQIENKKKEIKDKENEYSQTDSKIKEIEDKVHELKQDIANKKKQVLDINAEIESKGEKESVQLQKELENLKIELNTQQNNIKNFDNELEKIKTRKEELKRNIEENKEKIKLAEQENKDIHSKIKQKEADVDKINKKILEFESKNNLKNLQGIEEDIEKVDKESDELMEKIQELRQKQQLLLREKDQFEIKINNLDSQMEKMKEIEKENKEQLKILKEKRTTFQQKTVELSKKINEDTEISAQLSNARRNLISNEETYSKLNAKNIHINEQLAGDRAVSEIMKNKNKFGKVYGTVAELGNVDSKYSSALSAAAGNRLRYIVVDNDKTAENCIEYLKNNKIGYTTFLPLNKIKGLTKESKELMKELKNNKDMIDFAVNLVSYDNKFSNVFEYVFGTTLVVENISSARSIGIGKIRMVTTDGNIIESSGAMRGGFVKKDSGISFKEREMVDELAKMENEIEDGRNLIQTLEERKSVLEETIANLRKDKALLEGEVISMEKALHLDSDDLSISGKEKTDLKSQLKDVEKELSDVEKEISSLNRNLIDFKTKKQALRIKISDLRNPELLAQINTFEEQRTKNREEIVSLTSDMKNNEMKITSIFNPELENTDKILKQIEKEEVSFKEDKKTSLEQTKELSKIIKEKEEKQSKFYKQFKGLFDERKKISDKIDIQEDKVNLLLEKKYKFDAGYNSISNDLARFRSELAGLETEFDKYKGIELDLKKPEAQLKREITQFENMVENFGNVNLKALEIYESVEKEYNNLLEKKDKLQEEKNDVLIMINEIETKKKELFMNTFKRINENFKKIFANLTEKGDAYLKVENEENPFEEGVIFQIKLTGNKFFDIKSFSGGEKTLIALAFIFAIQEYEPAPFYVLDEVDAALDKTNANKLSQLIADYSRTAQYIMVSHNDEVISGADVLYGVSMNKAEARSKIVDLKVD